MEEPHQQHRLGWPSRDVEDFYAPEFSSCGRIKFSDSECMWQVLKACQGHWFSFIGKMVFHSIHKTPARRAEQTWRGGAPQLFWHHERMFVLGWLHHSLFLIGKNKITACPPHSYSRTTTWKPTAETCRTYKNWLRWWREDDASSGRLTREHQFVLPTLRES